MPQSEVCTAPKYWDKRQCFELDVELMGGKWGIQSLFPRFGQIINGDAVAVQVYSDITHDAFLRG